MNDDIKELFVDTEFNGAGGELLSLAMVSDPTDHMYIVRKWKALDVEPWIALNVISRLGDVRRLDHSEFLRKFVEYLLSQRCKQIVFACTSIQDVTHLQDLVGECHAHLKGMLFIYHVYRKSTVKFTVHPTLLHNALSDALCFYDRVQLGEYTPNFECEESNRV